MRRLEKKGSMNQRIDVVLRKFRSRMSSYPPGMCPLSLYRSLLQISMNQSCGKCVPCRDGLVEVDRMLRDILRGDAGRKRQDGWTRSPMRRNEEPLHIPGQESFLRRIQRHRGGRCPILRRCCRTPRQAVFHGSMLHPFQRQGIPKLFRPSFLSQSRRKSLF